MKRDGKEGTKENPDHLQKCQMVTQNYHEKGANEEEKQKRQNKHEEKMEKFTKNEQIPFDELSTSRGNTNNAESKRNLQNLLGSYYSSDEESEGESQQEQDLTQEGATSQTGKHQVDNQSDSDAEGGDNTDSISDSLSDEEGEACQGKKQTEQSTGNHGKTIKEKEEEPPLPMGSNPHGEETKTNYEEEEPASQLQNDKKKRRTSPPLPNKWQKTSHTASENKSAHTVGKINYNVKNSQSSFHRGYNVNPNWGTNPTQTNYHQPPLDSKSFFHNAHSGAGRQYPYDVNSQYLYNCGAPIHPKGNLNNLSLTNFGYSTKKEINVDLQNIPVIDQRQILRDWKPTIPEEKKKSQKYDIKTKVYNAASNTFDKVIIHGNKQKRKHQINWLAKEAVEKEYEILQKTNYSKRRTTNDKYGW
ncbi:Uncharacterized protein PCOAH_00040690 [Plasmodium coatneyi]|uniref:Uncharacterized protein n=1 Tax=Plasmodium coatneyi TaxID=208452 RepID=A0A1B1E4H5_9APIC|nr:Uncharacterized protein PCOAH_00040690 [Plasmodium coatneyi]ANQ09896.1 Uncharacterized protein PCOAH_00040690 [Plasmodium coatneyi]